MIQNHPDLIKAEIPEKSGEKGFIGKYQSAVTAVIESMSESKTAKLEETAERWNKEGAPAEVKLK